MHSGHNTNHKTTTRTQAGLNLVYIIGTYPLLTTTFIDREVETLQHMGMHIQLLSVRRPPKNVELEQKYGQLQKQIIYLLPVDWIRFILAHLYFALLRPLAYFKLISFLFTRPHSTFKLQLKTLLHFAEGVYAAFLLRGRAWDHVHAHFVDRAATVALCVGRLLDLSYSLTAHANDIYAQQVLIGEKIGESSFTVTVSEFNKAYLLKHYPAVRPEKIFVLHPWVDLTNFQPCQTRTGHSRLQITSVGRLVEKKGHGYLVEACRLLQQDGVDFECHILGDGPLLVEMQHRVAQYNLVERVHLRGSQPQAEVLSRLAQSDIFVLACVIAKDGDRDGMPVALAEAMAMELPAVSTNIVGIGELVRPEAGLLIPPNDPVALAEAIKKLEQAGPEARAKMGRAGRVIVAEEFEVSTGIRHLANLFRSTVQQRSSLRNESPKTIS
jgi:glycosyltransferase involved in cell wall biosynthesis